MNMLTLLYPGKCMLCRERISEEQRGLCPACRAYMEKSMKELYCPAPGNTDGLICAALYQGRFRRAIVDYKFNGRYAYGKPLAELAMRAWELHHMPKPDVVTCVPISRIHIHGRGFNQSAELARWIAAQWDVPFMETLRRRVLARRQSDLNAEQRWSNARRTFFPYSLADVEGKTVVLVDDVVTTGATVSTCAGILREMGAICVWALAAAKTDNNIVS